MALIDNILTECRKRGISVAHLEREAGISENSIYKWRNHAPSADKLQMVAGVLGTTMDELMKD